MGDTPCSNSLSSSSFCSVVAPHGADSNTEVAGIVRYTDFDAYSSSGSPISTVSSFIRSETGDNFYGTRMMVAEWNGVSRFNGISVSFWGEFVIKGLYNSDYSRLHISNLKLI